MTLSPIISHWLKQSIWFGITHSRGCWLWVALHTHSHAGQIWWWWWLWPATWACEMMMMMMSQLGPWGGADVCYFSPQPDTSLHGKTMDTWLVHRTVCMFIAKLLLILTAPTHGGMARLSCRHSSTNHSQCSATIEQCNKLLKVSFSELFHNLLCCIFCWFCVYFCAAVLHNNK